MLKKEKWLLPKEGDILFLLVAVISEVVLSTKKLKKKYYSKVMRA